MRPVLRRLIHLILLLGALPGAAQLAGAPPDSTARDFRQRLLRALDLTAAQRDSLRAWRGDLEARLVRLREQAEQGELLAEERRLRYRELLETYRAQRDSVLDPRQRALLRRAWAYERQRSLHDDQAHTTVPQSLPEALDLTPEQRDRWLTLLGRLREQVQIQEEAGEPVTTQDLRRLHEQYVLGFEALLTPPQLVELERLRQERAATADGDLEPGFDLLDENEASEAATEDAWKRLESGLGEEGPAP